MHLYIHCVVQTIVTTVKSQLLTDEWFLALMSKIAELPTNSSTCQNLCCVIILVLL